MPSRVIARGIGREHAGDQRLELRRPRHRARGGQGPAGARDRRDVHGRHRSAGPLRAVRGRLASGACAEPCPVLPRRTGRGRSRRPARRRAGAPNDKRRPRPRRQRQRQCHRRRATRPPAPTSARRPRRSVQTSARLHRQPATTRPSLATALQKAVAQIRSASTRRPRSPRTGPRWPTGSSSSRQAFAGVNSQRPGRGRPPSETAQQPRVAVSGLDQLAVRATGAGSTWPTTVRHSRCRTRHHPEAARRVSDGAQPPQPPR